MSAGIHSAPSHNANAYVLAGRPLRPGARLEDTSRYGTGIAARRGPPRDQLSTHRFRRSETPVDLARLQMAR